MANDCLEFPPFRLDLEAEQLFWRQQPIDLRPKCWKVLRYLAERPGRLVTSEELLDDAWGGVAVTPASLNQVILELRAALGDDSHNPRWIKTVRGRGFRFFSGEGAASPGRPAWLPLGEQPQPSQRPLIGRERALARLGAHLEKARAGRRQIVFVTGEPGIGKTALVRSFLERLTDASADEPLWITMANCVELHGGGESYLPILEALERLVRDAGASPVVDVLRRWAPSWLPLLPSLAAEKQQEKAGSALVETPTRMLREFCNAAEALSMQRPLVLWLEDLHWSDAATVDLLAALAARSDPARLLVLASYRPVEAAARSHPVAPLKRSLRKHGQCEELSLELLDERSVGAILSQRLGAEAEATLAALVHERTEGNPLFVITLADHLVAEGLLEATEAGWQASGPLDVLREAAPKSLAAVVESQLDRLDSEELELLQAGSACGQTFAAQAVAAVIGCEVELAEKVCGRLAGWGRLVEAAGSGYWPDGSAGERYRFLHAVYHDVLYRGLPAGQRQRLHQRIGKRLEAGFGSQSAKIASELALHFERGGDPERAVEHLVAAAAGVRQRSGDREAVAYFERALALLATLEESAEPDQRELELRMQQWREVNASGAITAVAQDAGLERALQLCDRIGDARSRAYVSSYLTRSLIIECKLDAAEAVEEQRVKLASSLGEPVLLAAAHSEIGDIAYFRGELDRAQREYALCLAALEGVDPPETCRLLGHDPATLALGYLGWVHWLQGRPDEARRLAAADLARAEACGYPLNRAFALAQALLVEVFRGDADAAKALAKSLALLAEEYGYDLPYPTICTETSWLLAQSGEIDAAIAQLREGIAASHRVRTRMALSHLLATLAETELEQGRAKEGLAAIDEALAFVAETGERFWEAEIHRLKGELLLLAGEDARVEACFQAALDVARRQGALSLELRAATSLAGLWKDTGRRQEARILLSAVYSRFTEGFDTADLLDAKSLLDSL